MKKRLIEIEETDKYFNECVCCGTKEGTKKVTIGNSKLTNSYVLCRSCRVYLHDELEESLIKGELLYDRKYK